MIIRSARVRIWVTAIFLGLGGCSALPYNGTGFHSGYVQVRRGETLYSIAWRYDLDYHQLARWNDLAPPYTLAAGQWLRMNPPQPGEGAPPAQAYPSPPGPSPTTPLPARPSSQNGATEPQPASPSSASVSNRMPSWIWPTKGQVVQPYTNTTQGIDIAGQAGQPVVAAASGQVVYSGDGLPSYGNLIIIKHNGRYLSAYGHNRTLLVKEGDMVRQGQTIALMGETGTGVIRPMLFFEIRVDGNPVNPIPYLPKGLNK